MKMILAALFMIWALASQGGFMQGIDSVRMDFPFSFPSPRSQQFWDRIYSFSLFRVMENSSFLKLEYDNIPPSAGQAQKEKRNPEL